MPLRRWGTVDCMRLVAQFVTAPHEMDQGCGLLAAGRSFLAGRRLRPFRSILLDSPRLIMSRRYFLARDFMAACLLKSLKRFAITRPGNGKLLGLAAPPGSAGTLR